MAATPLAFYSRMFTELNTALDTYVQSTATKVIDAITPVATTLLTIYVMLWGWSMMRGIISEPITDGVNRIVRLSIITGIALQLGYYNSFIVDFLWNSPDAMGAYISGDSSNITTAAYLDTLMSKMNAFADAYKQKADANSDWGIPDLSLWLMSKLIWFAGLAVTAYGAFLLALAKIGLAIGLSIGPIFVLLTIFESTKRFFDSWMGQILNYVFMVILSVAAMKLILTVLETYLTRSSGVVVDPTVNQALPALAFALIGTLTLVQVPSMASALGGGIALSTLGAVAWSFNKLRNGLRRMRPSNVRRSFNRARADARAVKGAATSTARAATAVYRRITGRGRNSVSSG